MSGSIYLFILLYLFLNFFMSSLPFSFSTSVPCISPTASKTTHIIGTWLKKRCQPRRPVGRPFFVFSPVVAYICGCYYLFGLILHVTDGYNPPPLPFMPQDNQHITLTPSSSHICTICTTVDC